MTPDASSLCAVIGTLISLLLMVIGGGLVSSSSPTLQGEDKASRTKVLGLILLVTGVLVMGGTIMAVGLSGRYREHVSNITTVVSIEAADRVEKAFAAIYHTRQKVVESIASSTNINDNSMLFIDRLFAEGDRILTCMPWKEEDNIIYLVCKSSRDQLFFMIQSQYVLDFHNDR